jgi:hypothetical protein
MIDAPYAGPERRSHGQRRTYQAGCRCTPCKAAEAVYRSILRLRKAKGLPPVGKVVSAIEARRRIRQLLREGYTRARLAEMLGRRNGKLPPVLSNMTVDPRHVGIRIRTLLRIRRIAAEAMLEGTQDQQDGDVEPV